MDDVVDMVQVDHPLSPNEFHLNNILMCFEKLIHSQVSEKVRCVFLKIYAYYTVINGNLLPIEIIGNLMPTISAAGPGHFRSWFQFGIEESLGLDPEMDPAEWVVLAASIGTETLMQELQLCFDKQIITPARYIEALEVVGSIYILKGYVSRGQPYWKLAEELRNQYKINQMQKCTSSIHAFNGKTLYSNLDDIHLIPNFLVERAAILLERHLGTAALPSRVPTNFMTAWIYQFRQHIRHNNTVSYENVIAILTLLVSYGSNNPKFIADCGNIMFKGQFEFYYSPLTLMTICGFIRALFRSANPWSNKIPTKFHLLTICTRVNLEELNDTVLSHTDSDNLLHLMVAHWLSRQGKKISRSGLHCEAVISQLLRNGAFSGYPVWYLSKSSHELLFDYFNRVSNNKLQLTLPGIMRDVLSHACDCIKNATKEKSDCLTTERTFSPPPLRCLAAFTLGKHSAACPPDVSICVAENTLAALPDFMKAHSALHRKWSLPKENASRSRVTMRL